MTENRTEQSLEDYIIQRDLKGSQTAFETERVMMIAADQQVQ